MAAVAREQLCVSKASFYSVLGSMDNAAALSKSIYVALDTPGIGGVMASCLS